MKTKSISVENLGSIVKQMINGALEDTEQVAKLHQVIYEEWYFKKIEEIKTAKDEKPTEPEGISATVAHRRTRKRKYRRQTNQPLASVNSGVLDNTTRQTDEIDSRSTTSTDETRTEIKSEQSCTESAKQDFNDREPTPKDSAVLTHSQRSERSSDADVDVDKELIEIWNNPTQRLKETGKSYSACRENFEDVHSGSQKVQVRERLSFDTWKRKKTMAYRRMFKEQQKERQRAVLSKVAEMERKKFVQDERMRIKQQQENRRRLTKKYFDVVNQANAEISKNQISARRLMNEQAFSAWKRQKDIKLKEEKKLMPPHGNRNEQYGREQKSPIEFFDAKFGTWLNQLDWVLHKKYLRERRHLVRSFYCQPVYYGDATMCVK